MGRRKTNKQFIEEAIKLCKNEYLDFSNVEYKNTLTKLLLFVIKEIQMVLNMANLK